MRKRVLVFVKPFVRAVSALLVLSSALLGLLVPGGPVETRDFSHLSPVILAAFNTFLTGLGIGSFVCAYFALQGKRWALVGSFGCGISYFLVYALDLGKIFPVSPNEMPVALLAIEIAGVVLSLPLTFLALRAIQMTEVSFTDADGVFLNPTRVLLMAVMVLAGIGIIIFATRAAMGQ